jgi:hypothetical protein
MVLVPLLAQAEEQAPALAQQPARAQVQPAQAQTQQPAQAPPQ